MSGLGLNDVQARQWHGFPCGSSWSDPCSGAATGISRRQIDFCGMGEPLTNSLFVVPETGDEQNTVASLHLSSNGGAGHSLTTCSHLDVDNFPLPSTAKVDLAQDLMQHRLNVPDAQQLADLPESQLENIAKDVAHALTLVKQKNLQLSLTSTKKGLDVGNDNKVKEGLQNNRPKLKCEFPGCTTAFRRNKDRTRHIRNKHQEAPGFICPVVDCPMGTGHVFPRSDKLRDHLRGKAITTRTWRCVIRGCSETCQNKAGWFDHIKWHDHQTRLDNADLLTNYGYKDFYGGYLLFAYLCGQRGCPFGTKRSVSMDEHLLIRHDGPHCPCPIPDCGTIHKDWEAVAQHLASYHSSSTRKAFSKAVHDQGFGYYYVVFTCPIPHCHQTTGKHDWHWNAARLARRHCNELHKFEDLLSAAESLVRAWRFSFEFLWVGSAPFKSDFRLEKPSSNQIFAYLAFPDAELYKVEKVEDLDQLCLERGINLP